MTHTHPHTHHTHTQTNKQTHTHTHSHIPNTLHHPPLLNALLFCVRVFSIVRHASTYNLVVPLPTGFQTLNPSLRPIFKSRR